MLNQSLLIFNFYLLNSVLYPNFQEKMLDALKLVSGMDFVVDPDQRRFVCYEKNKMKKLHEISIGSENFHLIQEIVRKRNCLEDIEEEIENPSNESVRELLERRKAYRERLRKIKESQKEEGGLTIFDLIGILASGLHMPLYEVFEYDIFQFNNQFNRLKMFDDYSVNIQALIHGADEKKINLTHWMSKLKT